MTSIDNATYIYTDGSCIHNGYKNAKAGYGIFFGVDDPRNVSRCVPDTMIQTNNVGELMGIIEAIKIAPKNKPIIIYTDSEYALKMAPKTEFKKDTKNLELVKELSQLVREHNIILRHIRSHTNLSDRHSIGNENADRLANEAIGSTGNKPEQRVYLNVLYAQKEDAKKLGARWDPKQKQWYASPHNQALIEKYT